MNETCLPCDDEMPLWMEIIRAAGRVESLIEARLAESGLSLPKLGLLRVLVKEGEPIPLSRVAGKLSCVKSNVTQLVDRLEADGLVVRINDASDRRSVLASVTDAGRERFELGVRAVETAEKELFGDLPAAERERLLAVVRSVGSLEQTA